jgi:hypothetical protein
VNPPADAEQAASRPQYDLGLGSQVRAKIGELRECATLPDPSAFRYVLLTAGGRTFAGYLWETT